MFRRDACSTETISTQADSSVHADGIRHAGHRLARGAVAAIADRPALQHFLNTHLQVDLRLSLQSYEPQGYGFAVRAPVLQQRLNVALLELAEQGALERFAQGWLGGQ
jgi:ABC-type amino acid transport substrate-binding protein